MSDLIDRSLNGEEVVIVPHGAQMIELKPIQAPVKPIAAAQLDWLTGQRLHPKMTPAVDAGALVSSMRDEDEH